MMLTVWSVIVRREQIGVRGALQRGLAIVFTGASGVLSTLRVDSLQAWIVQAHEVCYSKQLKSMCSCLSLIV